MTSRKQYLITKIALDRCVLGGLSAQEAKKSVRCYHHKSLAELQQILLEEDARREVEKTIEVGNRMMRIDNS